MKGGGNHIQQHRKSIPHAFSRIGHNINTKRAQNTRFGFLKNKFWKAKALEQKKLEISSPTNLRITSSQNQQSGHFNGSKFVFHHNNQPSQVTMVPEVQYN